MKYSKELPNYTKGEEIFNGVSHIVGGAFGIVALVVGLVIACIHSNVYGVVSMSLYGSSMILLYTSAPYLEGIRIAGFPAAMQESNAIAAAISDLHRMP